MKILTLEKTQTGHKEQWFWIAVNTYASREKVKPEDFTAKNNLTLHNDMYCCEFRKRVIEFLEKYIPCERLCPLLNWGYCQQDCHCVSLYQDFFQEPNFKFAADIAQSISDLPFKKAFNITPEDAKKLRDAGFGEIYSVYELENCKSVKR